MMLQRYSFGVTLAGLFASAFLYCASYFACVHYIDIGDGNSYYLVSYHFAGQPLNRVWRLFEPARRVDMLLLRPKYRDSSLFFRQDGSVVDIVAK